MNWYYDSYNFPPGVGYPFNYSTDNPRWPGLPSEVPDSVPDDVHRIMARLGIDPNSLQSSLGNYPR